MKKISISSVYSTCHKAQVWYSSWQNKLVCGGMWVKNPNHCCENRLSKVYIKEGFLFWKHWVKYDVSEIKLKEYPKVNL